jgi:hypothetical protein
MPHSVNLTFRVSGGWSAAKSQGHRIAGRLKVCPCMRPKGDRGIGGNLPVTRPWTVRRPLLPAAPFAPPPFLSVSRLAGIFISIGGPTGPLEQDCERG